MAGEPAAVRMVKHTALHVNILRNNNSLLILRLSINMKQRATDHDEDGPDCCRSTKRGNATYQKERLVNSGLLKILAIQAATAVADV